MKYCTVNSDYNLLFSGILNALIYNLEIDEIIYSLNWQEKLEDQLMNIKLYMISNYQLSLVNTETIISQKENIVKYIEENYERI